MVKSLVVLGKNLEEALNKGAVLLHCARESVAYEILQEPKPARYGQPGVPCKLRVTAVAPAAQYLAPAPSEDNTPLPPMPWNGEELAALPSADFVQALEQLIATTPEEPELDPSLLPSEKQGDKPLREILCDVSLSTTGPIHHDGDVRIFGSVRKGMTVQASGGIHVIGDVETAFLDAGGDILISGGLLGTTRSAGGSIACKFAQGAHIEAPGGDITVRESAMHARLHAGRSIFIGDIVLGGSCYGEGLVEVRIAGSESGVPALLITGRNKRLHEEVEQIRCQAQRAVESLGECDRLCHDLLPAEQRGEPLPVADRTSLWRAFAQKSLLSDHLHRLSHQKSALLGMINADRGARIRITSRAFPKVKILIDDLGLEIRNVTQYATFSKDYETGEIRMTSYS